MQWDGEGLIIGVRRHGESSVIADVMVAGRGRHLGLIRGGRSTRLAATLQPGNTVQVTWRARLEQHLGTFQIELLEARAAALIADRLRLYASQLVCEHLHLLPERDPHDRLLALALRIMDEQGTPLQLGAAVARYELVLLEELGFGLDLASCAATGVTTNLTHVSPRTGRAVCREAAEPYISRLLRLPAFLVGSGEATPEDVVDAFRLTGHFLDMHVWMPRQVEPPAIRDTFVALVSERRN
ncbi:MAG: DNA repair protein RecO [Devosia sp.]|uniref:DNA repair protein RecO n=1 Tax=Devosia sp. TaxID=1871048 RepID=UPI001AD586F8|nr:DNA repair protein RecO [Devosia sp.]MBN9317756.1 DNA repair protein RecO [Devosia sp.]